MMNKQQKENYYNELKRQYDAKLMSLIGLYLMVIGTSWTIIIPILLFFPIIMLHSARSRLRAEMAKF